MTELILSPLNLERMFDKIQAGPAMQLETDKPDVADRIVVIGPSILDPNLDYKEAIYHPKISKSVFVGIVEELRFPVSLLSVITNALAKKPDLTTPINRPSSLIPIVFANVANLSALRLDYQQFGPQEHLMHYYKWREVDVKKDTQTGKWSHQIYRIDAETLKIIANSITHRALLSHEHPDCQTDRSSAF